MRDDLTVTSKAGVRFEDGADHGRILVFGRQTGGKYSLMEYVVAARETFAPQQPAAFAPHLHRAFEETFLVQVGTLEFLLGDEVVTLNAGDFVRVPPGLRHGYVNTSGAEVRLLISFMPGGFEELFVKYRTDRTDEMPVDGFISDATKFYASEFEA
jgi:quercetin dioxygenase-like cupin family protein